MNRKKDIKQDEIIFITVRNPTTGRKRYLSACGEDMAKEMIVAIIEDGKRVIMDNKIVINICNQLRKERRI